MADCQLGAQNEGTTVRPLLSLTRACGRRHPSSSMTWEPSIYLARSFGWSANVARPESSTICPTYRPQTTMKQLAGAIKARWISEQGHQKIKEELELDHFEGRSWTGLHRHCLMSMIAFAFLQNQRLKKAKGGKKTIAKPPPQPSLPAIRQEILIALAHPPPSQCPHAVNP
jgi:SRSO17 transposase